MRDLSLLAATGVDALWLRAVVTIAGLALGLVACAGLAVVEWAAWMLVLPGRRSGTLAAQLGFATDPEGRPGEAIEAVASDGVRLGGTWHAAEAPRGGTTLLIHGFAEHPEDVCARIAALNRHGWDVAALDSRAHGRSAGNRSSFGGREGGDVSAWIDALTSSGRLRSGPLAVWGRSMGVAISTRAAADDPRIAVLVLESPYVDLKATLAIVLRRKRVPLPGLIAHLVARRAQRLAGISLVRPRPIDLVPKINVPVLIVHGTDDALIPLAEARRLAESFPRSAQLIAVQSAAHNTVIDVGGASLLDSIATFLDEAVTGRA
jgi:alpha-beta hydrolase superfamily lysophospholipase